MLTRIKALCFYIATFGGLGEHFGGSIIATLAAIPALFLLRALLFWLEPTVFVIACVVAIISSFIIIQLALQHQTDKDPSVIIIDKFLAFLIALNGIQPGIKIIIVSIPLFFLFRFLQPILAYRFWNINFYELPLRIFNAFIAGIILNIFLRLILWIGT